MQLHILSPNSILLPDAITVAEVRPLPDALYTVGVRDGLGKTSHQVSLRQDYYSELTDGIISPVELINISFKFLLSNEPKDAILSQFELPDIQHYFPHFEDHVQQLIDNRQIQRNV
jgi:hypothetical protein